MTTEKPRTRKYNITLSNGREVSYILYNESYNAQARLLALFDEQGRPVICIPHPVKWEIEWIEPPDSEKH